MAVPHGLTSVIGSFSWGVKPGAFRLCLAVQAKHHDRAVSSDTGEALGVCEIENALQPPKDHEPRTMACGTHRHIARRCRLLKRIDGQSTDRIRSFRAGFRQVDHAGDRSDAGTGAGTGERYRAT